MRRMMKHNATQVVFNDLSGGINIMSEGDLIAQNEMQECVNFYFLGHERSLRPRGGLSRPLMTFPVAVRGTFYDVDSNTFLVFLVDGSVYRVTSLVVPPEKVGTVSGGRKPICAKFQDRIWIASGAVAKELRETRHVRDVPLRHVERTQFLTPREHSIERCRLVHGD